MDGQWEEQQEEGRLPIFVLKCLERTISVEHKRTVCWELGTDRVLD